MATEPDIDSAQWLATLRESGPAHDDAVARLHGLLLRVGLRHAHSRAAGTGLGGPELDDLAHQAASDALLSILRRLDSFRGESRFTTWAYKFVILEVSSKIGRHFWQRAETSWDEPDWTQLPAAFGASPEETLAAAEIVGEVQFAVAHHLTEYQREIFVHVVVEGIPLDALVARLGITRGTVYKAVFDARRKIRKHLTETGHLAQKGQHHD
ncbi:RNA polymerase sigma factor [Leekyejoonella antrihumi]|uniref:RNA polymerase sigma factor n=1 Tax=Leekyejoonella antrihumi TaxID=1660198 RepID=UPI001C97310C|nr:sigma-70 family RNA polymerase sigma factor [Leekyejoonella antrihumi]